MRIINTKKDLAREVSECGLSNPELYNENWIELVTDKYLDLLREKYNFSFGEELPKLENDDEFWDLFEEFEIEEINQTKNLVSEITGYSVLEFTGARNEHYYSFCSREEDKLECLQSYIENVKGFDKKCNIPAAYKFIKSLEDGTLSGKNNIYQAFNDLKDLD